MEKNIATWLRYSIASSIFTRHCSFIIIP